MSDADRLFELNRVLLKVLEGQALPGELEKLNELLVTSPEALKDYCETIDMYADMTQYGAIYWNSPLSDLKPMADYERTAPALEIKPIRTEPKKDLIKNVIYPKTERRINKVSLAAAVLLSAALLTVIGLVQLIPIAEVREVATLSASVKARFTGNDSLAYGSRLTNRQETYYLKEGVVRLVMDNGAQAVIEAPCEFRLESAKRLAIFSGKVYAQVSGEAVGFTIDTPTATIIDMGTEFAVKINYDGSSEVHVVKGKTELLTATNSVQPKRETLDAGQARQVDLTGQVTGVPLRQDLFVRQVDSHSVLDLNFDGLKDHELPSGWVLVDNNGPNTGPDYITLADGPSGAGDACGRIGPADGSLERGFNVTAGGWIQCLKLFDSAAGFEGGFDFRMNHTSDYPDAQFLFGHISQDAKNYFNVAVSNKDYFQELITISDGLRSGSIKAKQVSELVADKWYHLRFRFIPLDRTKGYFSYEITDLKGENILCFLDKGEIALPETLTFGFGSHDDTACFDNIKILPLSRPEGQQEIFFDADEH